MKLSVIIVSYNAFSFLRKCLETIKNNTFKDLEVLVFDNNSTEKGKEDLKKEYPWVQFIFSKENLGFSKGNNAAVKQAKGEYVLILNPDTELPTDFFNRLLLFVEQQPCLGAVGVQMKDEKGIFRPESKRNIPTPQNTFKKLFGFLWGQRNSSYYYNQVSPDENGEVPILSGACMLMKKSVYQEVGGFDEQYFMYGEDIDLSYTLLRKSYKNYYMGELSILHYKGECTVKNEQYLQRFYGAMQLFVKKYYKKKSPLLYMVALLGLKMRYLLAKMILLVYKGAEK